MAALVIYFKPEWAFIDPICTFLFSILVLVTTFNIIKDVLNVFMEGDYSWSSKNVYNLLIAACF